ncbi:MAG: CoA pyrophosphatase [Bacteroidetes bacterium]|nr:CoA pyrophosphatase [Bacteroidota bacterium]
MYRKFDEFIVNLKSALLKPLPGLQSQLKLAPVHRIDELQQDVPNDAIESSVLILLFPFEDKIQTCVILRTEYDGVHSGQISLPGGRKEVADADHSVTALRETREEIGVDESRVTLLGPLSALYINRSNYVVFPYVGYTSSRPTFTPEPGEVQAVIELDIEEFLKPGAITHKMLHFENGFSLEAPGYQFEKRFIWGATAMIFSEFIDIISSFAEYSR